MLVKKSIFILVFLKAPFHASPGRGAQEVFQDHVHIFQNTYFKNSQIHQPTTIYRFEHINQNILLIFVVSKS